MIYFLYVTGSPIVHASKTCRVSMEPAENKTFIKQNAVFIKILHMDSV